MASTFSSHNPERDGERFQYKSKSQRDLPRIEIEGNGCTQKEETGNKT